MKRISSLIILNLLIVSFCTFSYSYVFETFDSSDGLVPGITKDIYQDHKGDLWIATSEGLSRYNGRQFQNFTTKEFFAGAEVNAIAGDDEGNLWIGTDNGLMRYDGKTFQDFNEQAGLTGQVTGENRVYSIFKDSRGYLWLSTAQGILRYDGEQFSRIGPKEIAPSTTPAQLIAEDRTGNLWFGTGSNGVFKYDGKRFQQFTTEWDGLIANTIIAVYADTKGNLWFGSWDGVSRYDGTRFHTLRAKSRGGRVEFSMTSVRAILEDSSGHFWFTGHEGLCEYDGEQFYLYTVKDGLPRNWTNTLLEDHEGNLWAGTWGAGIVRLERNFRNLGQNPMQGTISLGRPIKDKGGNIWCSLSIGAVHRYNGQTFEPYLTQEDGVPKDARLQYVDVFGNLWLQSPEGIRKYDGKRVIPYLTAKDGMPEGASLRYVDSSGNLWLRVKERDILMYDGEDIQYIFTDSPTFALDIALEDSVNNIWIRSHAKAARYDGQTVSIFTTEHGLPHSSILAIAEDDEGNIWMGAWRGVVRSEGRNFQRFLTVDKFENVGIPYLIFKDSTGNLWFGTMSSGICRYDGQNFQWFTTEDGLASNWIENIYEDSRGHLWLSGRDGGITHFDGRNFQRITTKDGLPSNYVTNILEHEASGTMLFVTERGIIRYTLPDKRVPPYIFITRIVADKSYEPSPELQLPHTATHITFEYYGKSLRTRRMRYNYTLEGYESEWHKTWDERAEYENLKPGEYTFKVIAIDRDLIYSEHPAVVNITILPPPLYQHGTFILSMILVAFFIPTIVYFALWRYQRRWEITFEPIPNPYIVGNPIRSREMFFGREDDFRFIQAKLGAGETGLVIVFAGERRSGKTSILFQILNGRLGEQFIPVLLDMQAMVVQNEREFLERIAMAVEDEVRMLDARYEIQDARGGMQDTLNPFRAFEGFMGEVMEAIEGRTLLLLFDEYELIEMKIEEGVLRPDIITFFAGLLEAHPRLSFIFTGSRHLEQRNPRYWQILIGKSLYRKISFLSEKDTLRLIREPVRGMVDYPRGIPERIYRLTAGQPFYTQVVCQNLIDRLNEEERRRVYPEDLEYVISELSDNPLPQMLYFWDGLKGDERVVLSLLGEVLENDARYASARDLVEFIRENGLELDMELRELEEVLDGLFVRDVLERDRAGDGRYEYRFRVDLLRHWVRRAHSVWGRG
jgi:ligand-binding sensor domain-containing protein/AAA+ ATPase superfamily predicted ATPase